MSCNIFVAIFCQEHYIKTYSKIVALDYTKKGGPFYVLLYQVAQIM